MIELRGLHLGNIARNRAESVRPDLWPDHAWVPALGCTGSVLYDLCGGSVMSPSSGAFSWANGGISLPSATNDTTGAPCAATSRLLDQPFCMYSAHVMARPGAGTGYAQVGGAIYSLEHRVVYSGMMNNSTYELLGAIYSRSGVQTERALLTLPNTWIPDSGEGKVSLFLQWTGTSAEFVVVNWTGNVISASSVYTGGVYVPAEAYYPKGYIGFRDTTNIRGPGGSLIGAAIIPSAITHSDMLSIHADPLLPFRRRQPVYYSVPSGGGTAETPAAMMMAL